MFLKSHYLLVTFLFASCVNSPEELGSIEYLVESIYIDLPENVSPNLGNPCILESDVGELLATYSYQDHSLVIFNLSDRNFKRKISLKNEGPSFVENVSAIDFYDKETIIIAGNNYLTLIDLDGVVLRRIGININKGDLMGVDFSRIELRSNQYSGLQFSHSEKTILMEVNSLQRESAHTRSGSKIAKVYIDKDSVALLNIDYPEHLASLEGDFGELAGIGFDRVKEGVLYNFGMSSDFFLKRGDSVSRFNLRSNVNEEVLEPIRDFSEGMNMARIRHQMTAGAFYPVAFDSMNNLFYRIHGAKTRNIDVPTEFFLMVYDERSGSALELRFPDGYYIFPVFSREGLMFVAFNKHDDKLELIRYRFNQ